MNFKTFKFIVLEYLVIAGCLWVAYLTPSIFLKVSTFIVISIRQHALFMIYHDAVHGHLHKNSRANDNIAYIFLSVPLLLPLHRFRALHLSHHADVGTPNDPEEIILYSGEPWNFKPLGLRLLMIQIFCDLFFINNLRATIKTLREEVGGNSRVRLLKARVYPEYYIYVAMFFLSFVFMWFYWPALFWLTVIYWVLPLLTLTHLLHKIRSFAEHCRLESESTMSWDPGLFGKLILWNYSIHFHREHHENPQLPWHDLRILAQGKPHTRGVGLIQHLWSGKL